MGTKAKVARQDKNGLNIPESWDKPKEKTANTKNGLANKEKQGIAAKMIAWAKEQYPDMTAKDMSALMSTAYTLARKASNGQQSA